MKKTKIEKAVKTLSKALRNDSELFYAYQANIAMQFKDQYAVKRKEKGYSYMNTDDVHEVANDAAKSFLALLIDR